MVRDTGMYLHRGCRMHFTSIERFIMCTGIEIISNQGNLIGVAPRTSSSILNMLE